MIEKNIVLILAHAKSNGMDGREHHNLALDCGKIELSLLNFTTRNPTWAPSQSNLAFIRSVREMVIYHKLLLLFYNCLSGWLLNQTN